MKSTTLRRANLSAEKIQSLENLARYKRQTKSLNIPDTQVQPAIKEREIDILWNNFKQNSKHDKSPTVYLLTGFIAGIVVMLLITALINLSTKNISETSDDFSVKTKTENSTITFIPADKDIPVTKSGSAREETYTVQSGDTLESIIIRFYGSYDKKHENAIKEVNGMANPNALSIGQKLIIPLN